MSTADRTPPTAGTEHPSGAEARPVQLRLLDRDAPPEWVLDRKTRQVGRAGVAQAREILRRAQPPEPQRQRDRIAS
ncbi:MAG TPA: hypothetical protein VFZ83_10980 [Acidimicrobiia bacterium]|nr:hypothetical protein [Acidimicrobiia bacterium]